MAEPWSAGRWSVSLKYTVVTVRSGPLSTGRGEISDGGRTSSTTGGQNFLALEPSIAEPQRTMFHPKKVPFTDLSSVETLIVQFPTGFSPLHHTKIRKCFNTTKSYTIRTNV